MAWLHLATLPCPERLCVVAVATVVSVTLPALTIAGAVFGVDRLITFAGFRASVIASQNHSWSTDMLPREGAEICRF